MLIRIDNVTHKQQGDNMTTLTASQSIRFDEIMDLNEDAKNLLIKLLGVQICDKGNLATRLIVRDNYLEYHFNDGTMLELAVVRDFNDNMNPVSVVLNHYYECNNFYTRLYTEQFKVS